MRIYSKASFLPFFAGSCCFLEFCPLIISNPIYIDLHALYICIYILLYTYICPYIHVHCICICICIETGNGASENIYEDPDSNFIQTTSNPCYGVLSQVATHNTE